MYRRSRHLPADPVQQESDIISPGHTRLFWCLDQIISYIPPEMREHPMAKVMTTMAREGKKDIRRIPEEYILQMSRQIGEAFTWVADGSMDDIGRINDDSH